MLIPYHADPDARIPTDSGFREQWLWNRFGEHGNVDFDHVKVQVDVPVLAETSSNPLPSVGIRQTRTPKQLSVNARARTRRTAPATS